MTGLKQQLVLATIVLCCAGALAIDLIVLPADPRVEMPSGPITIVFLISCVVALGASLYFARWQRMFLVAIVLSALVFIGPAYLALQSIDVMSAILPRRVWTLLLIWVLAVIGINRKRHTEQLENARAELARQVELRTAEYREMADTARRARSRLEQAQQQLDALTEVAFDGVILTEGGVIRSVSERCASSLGYAEEDLVGRPAVDLVLPAFRDTVARSLGVPRLTEPTEIALKRADGRIVYAECIGTDFRSGERTLRVSGIRDISRRLALEREIVTISERERTRIGYDLHDEVGQVLVSALWVAKRLARELERGSADLVGDGERLRELIEQAMEDTRRVSARLAPQVLSSREIYPALHLLSMDIRRSTDLNCTVSCSRQETLESDETTIHLYRIAEEAVSNALRHSGAKNIALNFDRHGDTYVLEVLDDGIGIPAETDRRDGVGVRSIRYRARLMRGTVEIARRAEGGTRLACAFPV